MSDDWIYDYDDKEFLYRMDDDYALGSDGRIVQNAGDNWGVDVADGDFHATSGWDSADSEYDDDDSDPWHDDNDAWSGSGSGSNSPRTGSSITKGDYVIVPEPNGAAGVPAEVVEARFNSRNQVPVPLETAKYVKKKIDAETYFALVDKREAAGAPTEETKTAPESREKTNPSDSKSPKWLNVILWIAAGILICVVVGAMVMALVEPKAAAGATVSEPVATETSAPTDTPEPTSTPAPTPTPEPTPVVTRLSDQETDDRITAVFVALEDVTDYVSEYREGYWDPDEVELTVEMIREQESIWAGYRDDMNDMLAEMDDYNPALNYQTAWDKTREILENIAQMADVLSRWDTNRDGNYTGNEAASVNEEARTWYEAVRQSMDEEYIEYVAAVAAASRPTATPKRTTPTPRPTATPKRSTSKSNSDPYNAGDYNDPDFFYDDWYDDFYDYDEAEEYWEEYGDW